jgi:hypothetical protein
MNANFCSVVRPSDQTVGAATALDDALASGAADDDDADELRDGAEAVFATGDEDALATAGAAGVGAEPPHATDTNGMLDAKTKATARDLRIPIA